LGKDGRLTVGRGPFVAEFRRGFVEAVACDAPTWAQHGPAILGAFPVCELRLAPWNVALSRNEMPAAEWAEHTDRAARVIEASARFIGAIAPAVNVLADAFRAFGGLAGTRYSRTRSWVECDSSLGAASAGGGRGRAGSVARRCRNTSSCRTRP
jgi:hypothetical protein